MMNRVNEILSRNAQRDIHSDEVLFVDCATTLGLNEHAIAASIIGSRTGAKAVLSTLTEYYQDLMEHRHAR